MASLQPCLVRLTPTTPEDEIHQDDKQPVRWFVLSSQCSNTSSISIKSPTARISTVLNKLTRTMTHFLQSSASVTTIIVLLASLNHGRRRSHNQLQPDLPPRCRKSMPHGRSTFQGFKTHQSGRCGKFTIGIEHVYHIRPTVGFESGQK